MRTRVKVCGITRAEDAGLAAAAGADAIGFVFWPRSPRAVTPGQAAAIWTAGALIARVGVFVNESPAIVRDVVREARLTAVQLHGDETAADAASLRVPVFRSMTLEDAETLAEWPDETTFLLDAADPVQRGGTGRTVDWGMAAEVAARRRVILAGGLTPVNVAEAIALVRPWGVDVSSGVEASRAMNFSNKVT